MDKKASTHPKEKPKQKYSRAVWLLLVKVSHMTWITGSHDLRHGSHMNTENYHIRLCCQLWILIICHSHEYIFQIWDFHEKIKATTVTLSNISLPFIWISNMIPIQWRNYTHCYTAMGTVHLHSLRKWGDIQLNGQFTQQINKGHQKRQLRTHYSLLIKHIRILNTNL